MGLSSILAHAIRLVRGQARIKSLSRRPRSAWLVVEALEERSVTTAVLSPGDTSLITRPGGATDTTIASSFAGADGMGAGQTVFVFSDGRTAMPGTDSVAGADQTSDGSSGGLFTAINVDPTGTDVSVSPTDFTGQAGASGPWQFFGAAGLNPEVAATDAVFADQGSPLSLRASLLEGQDGTSASPLSNAPAPGGSNGTGGVTSSAVVSSGVSTGSGLVPAAGVFSSPAPASPMSGGLTARESAASEAVASSPLSASPVTAVPSVA